MIFSKSDSFALKVREWLAILVLIVVVFGLAIYTSFSKGKDLHGQLDRAVMKTSKKGFEVIVKGAVDRPGVYRLFAPVAMKDLLSIAEIRSEADLRRFHMDQAISHGRVLNVPVRVMITIQLSGAVKNPGLIQVPKGTSVEDLLAIISLKEHADAKVLKKKRKLKADEVINIPFLKN